MQLSLAPILLAAELGILFAAAARSVSIATPARSMTPVYAYFSWLTLYGIVTSVLGYRGVYIDDELMQYLPGFWLQLITVAAAVAPVLLIASVRDGLRHIADHIPWHWIAYFQAMRIAALGTLAKTASNEFPLYFEILIGLPDLAFGISALWIARKAMRGELTARGFMIWNIIGALIIVPAAPILLQLGLPGPVQVFTSLPDARAVFTYPMSIAPMIGVPLFVLVNIGVAWRLWERSRQTTAVSYS